MTKTDQQSTHGPSWSREDFLASLKSADRAHAARLFELLDLQRDSYVWLGQRPNGGIFFHSLGLPYAPLSLHLENSRLMGRGTWRRYPAIRQHEGFNELAIFVGLDLRGPASAFPIAELDVERLWALSTRCAHLINGQAITGGRDARSSSRESRGSSEHTRPRATPSASRGANWLQR